MNMESTSAAGQERNEDAAASPVYAGRYARFGAFQADLASAELYQNGQRIKVQAKLFQALLVLLGRAGDIVTREDVRRQLWPDTSLTNLDAHRAATVDADLGRESFRRATAETLSAPSVDSINTFDNPRAVVPKTTYAEAKGGHLVVTIPPASVVVLTTQ